MLSHGLEDFFQLEDQRLVESGIMEINITVYTWGEPNSYHTWNIRISEMINKNNVVIFSNPRTINT